ncbi:MAG: GNAT family N-acetyltransferase, partial [Candidatus Rokuibacteriota bacterium]
MAKASYAVRLYEPELAEACARFVRRVWPRNDERGVACGNGAPPPPRVLFLKDGEVIGHVATVPVRLAVQGRLVDASWAVGLVVVPEHRNGPVAPLLVKRLNEVVGIGLTLHVEDAALRVFKGVGWRHLGVIPQYVRVLNAHAFVRTFARRGELLPRRWSRLWALAARVPGAIAALVGAAFA